MVEIELEASGFLYNMVRIVAGTLVEVGVGKRRASAVKEILEGRARTSAGFTVPPHGLELVRVEY